MMHWHRNSVRSGGNVATLPRPLRFSMDATAVGAGQRVPPAMPVRSVGDGRTAWRCASFGMNATKTDCHLSCCYRQCWNDGFGARGWKLAHATADPEVIASTAEAGERIATSVFVHDVLDHALCGLGPSGHRNEAVALMQLAQRTGVEPTKDFAQMVDEDLLHGLVLGESLYDFLPLDLSLRLPIPIEAATLAMASLEAQFGRAFLRRRLIELLHELGLAGFAAARRCYEKNGLEYRRRPQLGRVLQQLLLEADAYVAGANLHAAEARIAVTERDCRFELLRPVVHAWSAAY